MTEMTRALGPHTARDWTVPAGTLEWSCRETAVHVAHDLLGYAGQLASRAESAYLPMDLTVRPGASASDVLRIVRACSRLLCTELDAASPRARAWHHGACDPEGFAAMGVAETLLHTYDVAQGLGLAWRPPAGLSAGVLDRLFPGAPEGEPTAVLLWCTGRGDFDGRPRRTSWRWYAAR